MEQPENIGEGLTFEKVWAAIQENGAQIKESRRLLAERIAENDRLIAKSNQDMEENRRLLAERIAENDRLIAKSTQDMEETRRAMAEHSAETERQMKEDRAKTERLIRKTERQLNKRFGELTKRFGEIVEYEVGANLVAKFRKLGFEFTRLHRNTEIVDREHDIFTEVDASLENGDKVMIVETKSKPDIRDINDHLERMDKLRRHADLRNDKRIYLGAVAGSVMSESVRAYALKNGFYVIEPSGESFNIIVPQGEYSPREW
jgi:hypothetical protein